MKRNLFFLFALLIVAVAAFFRFYNYPNHWGLAIDQAHDALVARHMLASGKIPLLGVFSSAGPWQGSGVWYWFIAIGTAFNPSLVITPWIFMTVAYLFFVWCIIMVGRELIDARFGLLAGILAAVSPAQIAQSVNLTNQGPLSFTSLLALWSAIRLLRSGRPLYAFAFGFFAALGASIHLQGAAIFFFVIVTFIAMGKNIRIRQITWFIMGGLVALLPWLIGDAREGFTNIKNMIYYVTVDQYTIPLEVLGRRWLTYVRDFWPVEWGRIIGGHIIFGWSLPAVAFFCAAYEMWRKKLSKELFVVFISFLMMAGYVKYTRTPLFSSYLVFLHPFVLLISAWGFYELVKKYIWFGMTAVIVVVFFSGKLSLVEAATATNQTYARAREFYYELTYKYPGVKFALFDYKYTTALDSLALSLILDAENKSDENGLKIGFGNPLPAVLPKGARKIIIQTGAVHELGSTQAAQLRRDGWIWVYPGGIYKEAIEWKE